MWLIIKKTVYNNCVLEDNLAACLNVTKKSALNVLLNQLKKIEKENEDRAINVDDVIMFG